MDYMRAVDKAWPVLNQATKLHIALYRATGGKIGKRLLGQGPMLLLDHVGAKSGTKRTTPLLYVPDGEDFVLVASKGGHPRHPAWYHNLRANPDCSIQVGSVRRAVRAREARSDERPRLWSKAVDVYKGYRGYQQRTDREIPLLVLEPRAP
jgi:F420H(2)-dependent quinone reductase